MAYSCVKVQFEIGHEASIRNKRTPEGFTHDWEVFLRGADNTEIQHFVEKVIFNLHESFPKPKRVCKEPPYHVKETGYAGFNLPIDVYLKNRDDPKKLRFYYDLSLQPSGPPISNTMRESRVFTNPSEDFRRKLIKGGGVGVGSDAVSSHDRITSCTSSSTSHSSNNASTEDSKTPLLNKPKISSSNTSSDGNPSSKKHKIKESNKSEDKEFTDLFGVPIKKAKLSPTPASKSSSNRSNLESSSQGTKHSSSDKQASSKPLKHSPFKDKENSSKKEKDKENTSSKEKERSRDKEKSKDKDKSSKKSLSPSLVQSTTVPVVKPSKDDQSVTSLKPSKVPSASSSGSHDDSKDKINSKSYSTNSENSVVLAKNGKKHKEKKNREDKDKKEKDRHGNKEHDSVVKKENDKFEKEKVSSDKVLKVKSTCESKDSLKENIKKSPKIVKEERAIKEEKPKEKSDGDHSKEKEKHRHKHKKKEKNKKDVPRDKDKLKEKKSDKQAPNVEPLPPPQPLPPSPPAVQTTSIVKARSPSPPVTIKAPAKPLKRLLSELSDKESDSEVSLHPDSETDTPLPPPPQPPAPPPPTLPASKLKTEKEKVEEKVEEKVIKKKEKRSLKETNEIITSSKKKKRKSKEKDMSSVTEVKTVVKDDIEPAIKEQRSEETIDLVSSKEECSRSPTSNSKLTDEYVSELRDLQQKIMTLEDNTELQRVVQVIAETGQYEITKKTFDFDLCALDKTTVKRLQDLFFAAS